MQASPRVLLDGLKMVESPRWHDGRLWFPHWGTPEIIAVDLEGNAEVMAEGPSGLGQSIGWLPDGRMLETSDELTRYEPDGTTVRHADLSHITDAVWSEMTIDGRGNIYVNSIGFDFSEMAERVMDPRTTRPASSRSSPRTAPLARSPTKSRSPTAWSSPRTTRR